MADNTPETPQTEIEELIENLKTYVNTSMDLYKMQATEKGADIAAGAIINLVIGAIATIVLLFASLAAAFIISAYFEKMYMGFLIIAGLYSLIAVVLYLSKDHWLKGSMVNNIIKSIYKPS